MAAIPSASNLLTRPAEWERRRAGLTAGMFVFLPVLPAFVAYLGSLHLGYAPFGLGKWLACGFIAGLLWSFPAEKVSRKIPQLVALLLLVVCVWTHAAGFSSWALAFGIAGMLAWRQSASPRVGVDQTLAALAIFGAIVLPVLGADLAVELRKASIWCADRLLDMTFISHRRSGITFLVGDEPVTVLEKCSGSAITRMFLLLIAGGYYAIGAYRRAWFLAPLLAGSLGILCNALRIGIHLVLWRAAGPTVANALHESIGAGLFLAFLLFFLWRIRRLSFHGSKPDERATAPRRAAVGNPVLAAGVLILALCAGLLAPPWTKRMDHEYRRQFLPPFHKAYVNEFVEWRGGGGWILLEHPVEQCLAFQGWNLDARRTALDREGKKIRFEVKYRTGGNPHSGRWKAILERWMRPSSWRQPLRVTVMVSEGVQP